MSIKTIKSAFDEVAVPDVVDALWEAAAEHGYTGLLKLLVRYFLTIDQAATATFDEEGLRVKGFSEPWRVDDEDRHDIDSWLHLRCRPRSGSAVRNWISDTLQPAALGLLAERFADAPNAGFSERLRIGVRLIESYARELAMDRADGDERILRSLLRTADVFPRQNLLILSAETRGILNRAATDLVALCGTIDERIRDGDEPAVALAETLRGTPLDPSTFELPRHGA